MKGIKDLYFGVCTWDWNTRKCKPMNLFCSTRVLDSVALYKTGKYDEYVAYKKKRDKEMKREPLYANDLERWASWCFGDTRGRAEWEFGFGDPFVKDDGTWEGDKMDVFTVFVKPNAALLKQMVDGISVASCKRWLAEQNKRRGRYQRKARKEA